MSLHPDMREQTVAPKTVEKLRRAPRPIHTPRWLLPVAVVLFAVVAAIIGVNVLRSEDTTTTAIEPLIVPEEREFIDARTAELPRAPVAPSPDYSPPMRPTGVAGMIGYYESEYILNRVPQALLPSPASVGFPQLMTPEEANFGQGEYSNYPVEDWCLTHRPC